MPFLYFLFQNWININIIFCPINNFNLVFIYIFNNFSVNSIKSKSYIIIPQVSSIAILDKRCIWKLSIFCRCWLISRKICIFQSVINISVPAKSNSWQAQISCISNRTCSCPIFFINYNIFRKSNWHLLSLINWINYNFILAIFIVTSKTSQIILTISKSNCCFVCCKWCIWNSNIFLDNSFIVCTLDIPTIEWITNICIIHVCVKFNSIIIFDVFSFVCCSNNFWCFIFCKLFCINISIYINKSIIKFYKSRFTRKFVQNICAQNLNIIMPSHKTVCRFTSVISKCYCIFIIVILIVTIFSKGISAPRNRYARCFQICTIIVIEIKVSICSFRICVRNIYSQVVVICRFVYKSSIIIYIVKSCIILSTSFSKESVMTCWHHRKFNRFFVCSYRIKTFFCDYFRGNTFRRCTFTSKIDNLSVCIKISYIKCKICLCVSCRSNNRWSQFNNIFKSNNKFCLCSAFITFLYCCFCTTIWFWICRRKSWEVIKLCWVDFSCENHCKCRFCIIFKCIL